MTSLLNSVKNNNVRILQVMMSVPATIPAQDIQQGLLYACQNGYTDCFKCLLNSKVGRDFRDDSGKTLLHLAAIAGQKTISSLLVDTEVSTEVRDNNGMTALNQAVKCGNVECLQLLIDKRADINTPDYAGNTPLITAVRNSQYGCMRILLQSHCDVNVVDQNGRSALHYACHKAQCVASLLSSDIDTDIIDNDCNTPAMLASAEGFSGVVKALIMAGCNVNIQNGNTGRTILHTMAMKGHKDSVEDIVMAGGDINIYDKYFRTPLWYAIDNSRFDVIKYLFRANSDVDKFQCHSKIPIDSCPANLTISKGLIKVLKLFLITGYDSHHVRLALQESEGRCLLTKGEDLSHWIHHARGPLTLKQICRLWIRHHQGPLLFHDLDLLPVPESLKSFLSLAEIDDEDHI